MDPNQTVLDKLATIEALLVGNKEILTTDEAAAFLDMEKSYLFKLTSTGVLPFSKPNGKKLYFKREDLVSWAMSNRSCGMQERAKRAATYIATHKNK